MQFKKTGHVQYIGPDVIRKIIHRGQVHFLRSLKVKCKKYRKHWMNQEVSKGYRLFNIL